MYLYYNIDIIFENYLIKAQSFTLVAQIQIFDLGQKKFMGLYYGGIHFLFMRHFGAASNFHWQNNKFWTAPNFSKSKITLIIKQ